MTRQSRELLALVFHKNNRYFDRWRSVQLYSFPDWAKGSDAEARRTAELTRIDGEIADDEAKIETVRKPRSHRFMVKPVSP